MSNERPLDASRDCDDASPGPADLTRRRFLRSAAAAAALGSVPHLHAQNAPPPADAATPALSLAPAQPVRLDINGRAYTLHIEPRVTLL
ncbi:MAG TPA: hypothetical protein VJS30_02645, partial [Paraburkholderia sp.]|nr:hypothetical protein [Paraburkholderia sp.]